LPHIAVRDEIGDSVEDLVVSMRTELGYPNLGALFVAADAVVPHRLYPERGAGEVRVPDGRGDLVGALGCQDASRRADGQRVGWHEQLRGHLGPRVHQGADRDDRAGGDGRAVQDGRAGADIHTAVERAAEEVACGPTKTWSLSWTGRSSSPAAVARSTACSVITHASPTMISDPSASSTAPYMMRARGPTRTSPTTVAVGATYAVASTEGVMLRCLISMPTIMVGTRHRMPRHPRRLPPRNVRFCRVVSALVPKVVRPRRACSARCDDGAVVLAGQLFDADRVVVIGCAGSGKSTLAAALAARLGAPHVRRDGLGAEGSDEYRRAAAEAVSGERWVFDGAPYFVEELVYGRADLIVGFRLSRGVVMRRVITRSLRESLGWVPAPPQRDRRWRA
jgi:hypothetical protein